MEGGTKRRVNGLHTPFHRLQIATWAIYPFILIQYYTLLMPLIWNQDSNNTVAVALITLAFTTLAVLLGVAAYWTCKIDPADDAIVTTAQGSHQSVPQANETPSDKIYCYLCESNVHCSAKHCRYCDKCVTRFDHHCKWLNTCVGQKNYRYFLSVVGSVSILTTLSMALSLAFLIESFAYASQFSSRIASNARTYSYLIGLDATRGLLIASLVILVPLVLMVYQLAGFHAMIVWKGLTTYEFIVAEQKRQREKAQVAAGNKDKKKVTVLKPPGESAPSTIFAQKDRVAEDEDDDVAEEEGEVEDEQGASNYSHNKGIEGCALELSQEENAANDQSAVVEISVSEP
jgi:palmitoyltransferase ZDHHC1/11